MTPMSQWRVLVSLFGYVMAVLLIVLHIAFWMRAQALHGYWGHLNEATYWFQIIDVASLLVVLCCLFGIGWKRWIGLAIGMSSFILCCAYAIGL